MNLGNDTADCFNFGWFRWLRRQRVLLHSGKPARLGSRPRAILALLLESPGGLVTRQTIMDEVWPGTVVADVALRVHLTALRKILCGGLGCSIENIRGTGYL